MPQVIKTIKYKNSERLLLLSLLFWLRYGTMTKNYLVMVTYFITLIPELIIFGVEIKYR